MENTWVDTSYFIESKAKPLLYSCLIYAPEKNVLPCF